MLYISHYCTPVFRTQAAGSQGSADSAARPIHTGTGGSRQKHLGGISPYQIRIASVEGGKIEEPKAPSGMWYEKVCPLPPADYGVWGASCAPPAWSGVVLRRNCPGGNAFRCILKATERSLLHL